ncbi:hypothetical protein RZN22_15565 [Bacillaceae bacterium S4-13-58]
MRKSHSIYFKDIVINTMEDNASVNFDKFVLKYVSSATKTNVITGQITGDYSNNYLIPIDSDIYDLEGE